MNGRTRRRLQGGRRRGRLVPRGESPPREPALGRSGLLRLGEALAVDELLGAIQVDRGDDRQRVRVPETKGHQRGLAGSGARTWSAVSGLPE